MKHGPTNVKTSKLFIKYWNSLLNGDIILSSSDICVDTDTTNITLSNNIQIKQGQSDLIENHKSYKISIIM